MEPATSSAPEEPQMTQLQATESQPEVALAHPVGKKQVPALNTLHRFVGALVGLSLFIYSGRRRAPPCAKLKLQFCPVELNSGWLPSMRDLAPHIYRQRLVIEGHPAHPVTDGQIKHYLSQLSKVTDMVELLEPVTHRSDIYGWAGWIHWETSGSHFYAWEEPQLFFSVDIYTCKEFDPKVTVEFTRDFFSATDIEYREF
jgi:S-adenosylmethionine decarboxylase